MSLIKSWKKKRREKRLIRDIETTRRMLRHIDVTMQSMNMPHWKRKQVWTGFIKSQDQRKNVLEILNGVIP